MRVEEGNESEKNIKLEGKKTPFFFFNWFLKTLLFNETSAPSRVKKKVIDNQRASLGRK